MFGAGWFIFELHAQPPHVDIHNFDVPEVPLAPDLIQNLLPPQRGVGVVVSSIALPFLVRVRLLVLSTNGPEAISLTTGACAFSAAIVTRRWIASTRATSSDGENGLVT